VVLADAQQLGLDHLCRLPALPVRPPGDPAGEP
jgi:hypothetical protein